MEAHSSPTTAHLHLPTATLLQLIRCALYVELGPLHVTRLTLHDLELCCYRLGYVCCCTQMLFAQAVEQEQRSVCVYVP